MDLLCLCNSFGYSIVLGQESIGLNCRTQRLVFEALLYIQYCNLCYVYGLNYSCLKGIQASPVFIFKPAVCILFKYRELVLLQVSTQMCTYLEQHAIRAKNYTQHQIGAIEVSLLR